ncbi:uncharacterized protein [Montipora capricornis]|uniref:uncharacterized protein isoform X1 n=1 Tax=Montipora capricornis TaxID=246305 RepID=UPI0035F10034
MSTEHMVRSHRCRLRLCFVALLILSFCSVAFILTRGNILIYFLPATERINYEMNGEKRDLRDIYGQHEEQNKTNCRDKFEDILLVIAFVELMYDTIPHLEKLYRNHFPNIVYCGPEKSAEKLEYTIIFADILRGVTAYECLGAAMRTHLGFAGYLFMRNDLFFNFWNAANFSRSRIWESSEQLGNQVMFEQPRESWIWWYTPWGLKACEEAYKELIHLNDEYKRAIIDKKDQEISWDVENSLNALLWNGHGANMCYRGFSNLFYIPSEYVTAFEKLCVIFKKHQVYMEIAIPTIMRMLDLSEKTKKLSGIDLGSLFGEERAQNDDNLFWRHLTFDVSYLRPLVLKRKFSAESRTSSLIQALVNRLNLYNESYCAEYLT